MAPIGRFRTCEICRKRYSRQNDTKRKFMTKFPIDEDRCREWVKIIGNEDLAYIPVEKLHEIKYVCGDHFQSKDFNKKKSRLKKWAVPSLLIKMPPLSDHLLAEFPCHMAKSEIAPSSSVEDHDVDAIRHDHSYLESQDKNQHSLAPSKACNSSAKVHDVDAIRHDHSYLESQDKSQHCLDLTPRKKKLLKKLQTCKIKLGSLQKKISVIESIESPVLKTLITSTVKNQNRKHQARRWANSDKGLALSIYKKSPKAYRFLRHMMPLPSIRTLQTILQKMTLEPGVNDVILKYLKKSSSKFKRRGQDMRHYF